jgi:hypothetical protein
MLYNLLEEYAPSWYTSELDYGAELAAQHRKKVQGRPRNGVPAEGCYP